MEARLGALPSRGDPSYRQNLFSAPIQSPTMLSTDQNSGRATDGIPKTASEPPLVREQGGKSQCEAAQQSRSRSMIYQFNPQSTKAI